MKNHIDSATRLIGASVQDLRSSLDFWNKPEDLPILQAACDKAQAKGYKTKARLLRARIKRLEKELP